MKYINVLDNNSLIISNTVQMEETYSIYSLCTTEIINFHNM